MWASAHAGNAEWVQLITWNDYSEHTEFAPSNNLGWAALDLTAYYTVNFKMGIPPIVRDTIYVSHRRQPAAAMPTGGQTRRMTLRGGSSPARDQVEVLTFLRQAGAVEVRVGAATYRYNAPAGFYAYLAPLATGTVSAKATTTDGRVTAVTSRSPWCPPWRSRTCSTGSSVPAAPAPRPHLRDHHRAGDDAGDGRPRRPVVDAHTP
jgi:hypothetical protein